MEKGKGIYRIAAIGFFLSIASLAVSLAAGLGTRFEWFNFRMGLSLLPISAIVAIGAGVVSLIALILMIVSKSGKGIVFGIAGFTLGALLFVSPLAMFFTGKSVPPIHDITTDTENPPQFVDILPLRVKAVNSPVYGGPEIAAKQKKAFPTIAPVILNVPFDSAFEKALAAAKQMGWKIVSTVANEGRIEATTSTLWMGFHDDIVIRVKTDSDTSRVDIRSESRVGIGDFGTNAKRVEKYITLIKK